MRKFLCSLAFVFFVLAATCAPAQAIGLYFVSALTGGGADALDEIDGAGLSDGDIAIGYVSATFYIWELDASSGAAESSPETISPDDNAGTKRWTRLDVYLAADEISGDKVSGGTIGSVTITTLAGTSIDLGATTLLASRAITVDTGGGLDINMGTASGDDFSIDTSAFVVEGDTGNVGIGTTAPVGKLYVLSTSATEYIGRFRSNTINTGNALEAWHDNAGSSGNALLVRNDGTGNAIQVDDGSAGNIVFEVSATGTIGLGGPSNAAAAARVYDGKLHLQEQVDDFPIVADTVLGTIMFHGNDDTAGADNSVGQIQSVSTGTWVGGAEDAKLTLNAADNGVMNINQLVLLNDGNVGIGTTTPNQLLTVENSISLKEIADANADTAAYGQIWVHDSVPNELWFTDDAGTDTQLSSHPMDAPPELYTNGPGLDWMGVKRHKLLGIIQWQTLDGIITEETFEEYNQRRKAVAGHKDLVKRDYNTWISSQEENWKKDWVKANTTEIEIPAGEAIKFYEEDVATLEIKTIETGTETKHSLDGETGTITAEQIVTEVLVYETEKVTKFRLCSECRMDEKSGKCYKTVVPSDSDIAAALKVEFDIGLPEWMKDRLALQK